MPITFSIDNSLFITSGTAFSAQGPDSLTITQDGFLISQAGGNGATLSDGAWTIKNDGNITSLAGVGLLLSTSSTAYTSKITIGAEGSVYGGTAGIRSAHAVDISNKGSIFGSSAAAVDLSAAGDYSITNSGYIDGNTAALLLSGAGKHTITNSGILFGATNAINSTNAAGIDIVKNTGTIDGNVILGAGDDSFTNAGKGVVVFTNSVTKVVGLGQIDLGAGNDKFLGGAGADFVVDALGDDSYTFGAGNDLFKTSAAGTATELDKADGGTGIDTVDYSSAPASSFVILNLDTKAHGQIDHDGLYQANFAGGTAVISNIGIDTIKNFENAKGTSQGDFLFGSKAANVLEGNAGDDDLWGFAGNDTLDGGAGIDFLIGGAGKDTLIGGGEADNFLFLDIKDSGTTAATRDLIRGFTGAGTTASVSDLIGLSNIDAIAGGLDDAFTLLSNPNSKFTGTAGELRYEWVGLDTIIEGDVNGDAKADFSIAVEGAGLRFIASDFEL
jgi:hypothetical protein